MLACKINQTHREKYRSRLCHWGSLQIFPNLATSREKALNSSLQINQKLKDNEHKRKQNINP